MRFASEMHSFEPDWRPYVRGVPARHFWTPEDGFERFAVGGAAPARARRRGAEPSDEDYEETRDELIGSVHRQMMGDVPVGVFLSGGLDSTLIAAIAARWCAERGTAAADVRRGHRGLVRPAWPRGRRPSTWAPSTTSACSPPRRPRRCMPEVVRSIEHFDPSLVRSAVANFLLAEMTAEHVKVVLTGEGADELFAGYEYLRRPGRPRGAARRDRADDREPAQPQPPARRPRDDGARPRGARAVPGPRGDRLALRQPARWKLAPPGRPRRRCCCARRSRAGCPRTCCTATRSSSATAAAWPTCSATGWRRR